MSVRQRLRFDAAAITTGTVANNTINNFPNGAGIQFQGGNAAFGPGVTLGTPGSGSSDATGPGTGALITISNNQIGNTATSATTCGTNGIVAGVTGTGQGNFDHRQHIEHFDGIGIAAFTGNAAVANFFIDSNVIDASDNIFNSPGMSAAPRSASAARRTAAPSGPRSRTTTSPGWKGTASSPASPTRPSPAIFKIVNNTIGAPQAGVRPGIRVDSAVPTATRPSF